MAKDKNIKTQDEKPESPKLDKPTASAVKVEYRRHIGDGASNKMPPHKPTPSSVRREKK